MSLGSFVVTERISSGVFTQVLRAVRKSDSFPVVLKCYNTANSAPGMFVRMPSECNEPVLKEAYFLKRVQNVTGCVKIIDCFSDEPQNQYIIVLEDLASLGYTSLSREILNDEGFLTESTASWILRETISTLQHLHDLNVLHCDIKPDNIFIHRGEKRIKLLDFNIATELMSRELPPESRIIACTPEYSPPEVLIQRRPYTPESEVWSLGVTAFVLLCKKFPFDDPFSCHRVPPAYPEDLESTSKKDCHRGSSYARDTKPRTPPLSPMARDFLICCLHKIPRCRPNLQRLSAHPFITAKQPPRANYSTKSLLFDDCMRISAQAS